MKKAVFAFCMALLLVLAGCGKGSKQLPPESPSQTGGENGQIPSESPIQTGGGNEQIPPETTPDTGEASPDTAPEDEQDPAVITPAPAKLTVTDLKDFLDALDLSGASLTYRNEREEASCPAGAAIRAERYVEEIKSLAFEAFSLPVRWKESDAFFVRLEAPGGTLVAPQSADGDNRLVRLTTDKGEGWFILPYEQDEYRFYWQIYSLFFSWFEEAKAAFLYSGEGTPLTPAELVFFREYTAASWEEYDAKWDMYFIQATEISCFFTSHYSDPRDLDLNAFLAYCPGRRTLEIGNEEDEEEWLLVYKVSLRSGEEIPFKTLGELPVPVHSYRREDINAILMKYAGVTLEDMSTDWTEKALYVPETDCFYTFTSDFGPGTFVPCYGEKNGDIVTLWSSPYYGFDASRLTLQKSGEGWRIVSHEVAADW
ncbi:MAG: hypothetical protein GX189_09710 [Clostridiales bacterium]|nr:hypothetical protein [Clostridiales bacterium]